MSRPIIGIVGNIIIDQGGNFPGYERAYVNNDYVQTILKAGGVPFILPISLDSDAVKIQVECVDGIIISGGFDVSPLYYNEEPTDKQGFTLPERDEYDLMVISAALNLNKPILGICRGLQILNVALGGTLYQDLSMIEGCHVKHFQSSKPDMAGHTAEILPGTRLADILEQKIVVNSFHHQAIKSLANDLVISARAKDGVIEAVERKGDDFVLAVQWHPEMMAARGNTLMLRLFEKLVEESKK